MHPRRLIDSSSGAWPSDCGKVSAEQLGADVGRAYPGLGRPSMPHTGTLIPLPRLEEEGGGEGAVHRRDASRLLADQRGA